MKFLGSPEPETHRLKRGDMHYRKLGRTGLHISEVSLGGSPLPDWSLFREIIDRGVNYIDTSSSYSNGNSERQIGKLFKETGRDRVYVSTKFHLRGSWDTKSIIQSVEGSLSRLQTDYIDVLSIHGAERESDLVDERVLAAFEGLKKEGKYRFKGLSCHSNHRGVIKRAVECGHYDMFQLGYNAFEIEDPKAKVETYSDYLEESGIRQLISFAASHQVGVIAMKTLKVGGRRQNLEKYKTGNTTLCQAMLKWVLENKNIASAVTEMLNREEMEEDLRVAGAALQEEERKTLFRYVAENSLDYCHMCGRCQAHCPQQISTAEILRCLAYQESYGKKERAGRLYAELEAEKKAPFCTDCALCEKVCPYGVRVRKRIRQAHAALAA